MGKTAATHEPTPPNVGTPGAAFYLPQTSPSSGTALSGKDWPQNEKLPLLFTPITIGQNTFRNRIFVAPMCQYSAEQNGAVTPWHLVHLGSMAVRGAALVMMEATSVLPNGRISPEDLGLWNSEQQAALKPIADFVHAQGSRFAIQLAHAGRKASTLAPWLNNGDLVGNYSGDSQIATIGASNGWEDVWAPSAIPYAENTYPDPEGEMTLEQIDEFKQAWKASVRRADEAGVDLVEIHAAHGYLLHEFLSPVSNKRTDKYGGSLENRLRLVLEVIDITRETLSKNKDVYIRISASDCSPQGEKDEAGEWVSWGIEQSKVLLAEAIKRGVALMDVSSMGNDSKQQIKLGPGYQVPFADQLRASMSDEQRIPISAVGLITEGKQAEEYLQSGKADIITVAREFLRDADLVFNWAQQLGVAVNVPVQYQRAYTRMLKKQ